VSAAEVLEANVAAIRDSLNEFKVEVREFKAEVRAALGNINGEIKFLREKNDKNFERLSTKIDSANQELNEVSKRGIRTETRLNGLIWFWSGLGGVGGVLAILSMLGKIFHWFQ
jgi:chromosome segregation ATPase